LLWLALIIFLNIVLRMINLKRLHILLFLNWQWWIIRIPHFEFFLFLNLKFIFTVTFHFIIWITLNVFNAIQMVEAETFLIIHLIFFHIFNKFNIFLRSEAHETFRFIDFLIFLLNNHLFFFLLLYFLKNAPMLFHLKTIVLTIFG